MKSLIFLQVPKKNKNDLLRGLGEVVGKFWGSVREVLGRFGGNGWGYLGSCFGRFVEAFGKCLEGKMPIETI